MKETVGLLALAFAVAVVLRYGGLPFAAALLIGIALSVIDTWLYALKRLVAFRPYRLIIGINYASLWEDLKLTPAEGRTSRTSPLRRLARRFTRSI